MNGPIQFRAWDKLEKKWLGADAWFVRSSYSVLVIWPKVEKGFEVSVNMETLGPDRIELGQFTGLFDRHGDPIFSGDILQRPSSINGDYHGSWIRDEVIYKPGQWFVSHVASEKGKLPRGYTAGPLLDSYFDYDGKLFAFSEDYKPRCTGEIVGNRFEHPHLLEAAS